MDTESIILILVYFSSFTICIPLLTSVFHYKHFNLFTKALFAYTLIAFVVDVLSVITAKLSINNLFLSYIITLVEFSLFSFIFIRLIDYKNRLKLNVVVLSIFLIIFSIELFAINGPYRLNEVSRNFECCTIIIFSILYFRNLISKMEVTKLTSLFGFWFSTACIIYFSGTFFFFIFSNYLADNDPALYLPIYTIHSIFNITFNILLAISFTKKPHVA